LFGAFFSSFSGGEKKGMQEKRKEIKQNSFYFFLFSGVRATRKHTTALM